MGEKGKKAKTAPLPAEAARWLAIAREVLEAEAQAILKVAERLSDSLAQAVALILAHPGKVVVSGIGKSGAIAHKIAATLASTGTPAVFLHAAEAVHGDLGIYTPGDPSLLISKSGATAELLRLIPVLRRFRSPLIALVGNLNSPLAREADVVLDARVEREADTLNLAPTCSTTAALALGDALAVALMHARNFTRDDFARYHPAGQLGRNLWLTVADVMHRGEAVAWVGPETPLRQVIIAMTERPLGAACVVDEAGNLLGLITDGDLRRALITRQDIRGVKAQEIMTARPTTITPGASLKEAAQLMEDRPSQISVLPVVEPHSRRCLGLIRIHDIYQPELI
ncbi:MAG: KpsF/GutQ family sugar-phosphate isomerase [Desulfobaccales bacterium]